jgi:CheY-like chemotaxis protein
VKDTGTGIAEDRQHAIFERFVQADIDDKSALHGAGLGLAISKAYVDMLGGNIWVESEKDKGSIFYFNIPYITGPTEKPVAETENNAETNDNKNLKVLVVEDDDASEKLVSIIAKGFSKEILNAATGAEAVEICRNNPDIDLVLMDIKLPVMDGYEATRQIRRFNTDVVIIAQTAYGLTGDREKTMEAGCNDYISKPILKKELLALIQKYF